MRILHWTESYHPRIGGMEVFVKNLASSLQTRGHECVILTNSYEKYPDYEIVDGIPVYRFGFYEAFAGRNLHAIVRLTKQVDELKKKIKPDVLHLQTSQTSGFFYQRTQSLSRLPSLYTTHDPILMGSTKSSMTEQIFRTTDKIAAISSYMLQCAVEHSDAAKIKTHLLLNACPAATIEPTSLSFDPPVFLGLGRLVKEKGFDLLLSAFADAKKFFPSIKLIIAGDGVESNALQKQVQELGVIDSVDFRGWVAPDKISTLINEASIVVVPSRWQEPFGLVALQAIQMARPVIAARVGGLPEIVQDKKSGLLFESNNIQALSNAMQYMLSNEEQTRRWGSISREYAETKFSWDNCVKNYESIYSELAG